METTLIQRQPASTRAAWPWLMVVGRVGLLAGCQALFALGFYVAGRPDAWQAAIAWWPFSVTLANLAGLALLLRLFSSEGAHYLDIFRPRREHLRGDLLALAGLLLITGPVAYLPNVLLANALFGSPQAAVDIMLRPLPLWAAYAALLLFPVTQGLVELPTYFGYGMPRLERQGVARWLALALPAIMLGLQHVAVPLVFDACFLAWRGLMFLPFACLAGGALRLRPRLMPYLAAVHILMDMAFAAMLLGVAY